METVEASVVWDGPRRDVLMLFIEPPMDLWEADPIVAGLSLLRELDENEKETGRIVGVEIVGFLTFRWWDDVPELPFLWHVPGYEPMHSMTCFSNYKSTFERETSRRQTSRTAF